MLTTTPSRPRRRRAVAGIALGLLAGLASAVVPAPAGAAPAALVTEDGLGIRIDETAIQGPALEAIETAMQPYVDDMVQDGAVASSVMDDPDHVHSSADLELGFDFIDAGTSGYPSGGLNVHADIEDIWIEYYRYGSWWQPECWIWVTPDDATIDASAKVDATNLPATPLDLNPITATWDDDPEVEVSQWLCNGYLFDEWWEGFSQWFTGDDPESTASRIEAQLNGVAQDLVDDLWAEHVMPVVGSLEAYGISIGQLRTDDHGLIVTADVDATNGLAIPGQPVPPINVSTAEDSGTTSNVDDVLDESGEVIATIHPNVVNQFVRAIQTLLNGNLAIGTLDATEGAALEAILLPSNLHGSYPDGGWSLKMLSTSAPFLTAGSGAPTLSGQNIRLQFFNTAHTGGVLPLQEQRGTWANVAMDVTTNPGGFGPSIDATNVTHTMAKFSGLAASLAPTNSQITPFLQIALGMYDTSVFEGFVTLAPLSVGGISITPCAACTQFAGDQRFTKVFEVG